MTRLRLDISYDGTDFHGWAGQRGEVRTVQGELETWITRVLRLPEPAELACAGRTDAGVHARGQVAHLDLPAAADGEATAAELERRLARVLPPDVVVRRVRVAPDGFDARFAAVWRRYVYRLADGPLDPLVRRQVVRVHDPLDVDRLNDAASRLLGLHDFGGFCRRREGATTIRTLLDCEAHRVRMGTTAGTVAVTVRADAFCHSMVRSLVGALVAVASGRREPAWIDTLIDRADRAGEVTVMPPHGLVLEEVGYPADDALAARVVQAKARRDELPCDQEDPA
ncbi:tRNA pseudouridine(38-40) synthase TruA [Nigerium massiliense]|uniref:tRNA pseudouridine(38-40) synthase TruA n=1 Tax=Nigerium massiliense TaxID=1522317 RepID=UPI00058CEF2B|nr:tRNA pseudouridine(38-40) synthase TruA [Nigerium massiliense]